MCAFKYRQMQYFFQIESHINQIEGRGLQCFRFIVFNFTLNDWIYIIKSHVCARYFAQGQRCKVYYHFKQKSNLPTGNQPHA